MTTDDSAKEWNGPAYTVVRGHKFAAFDPEVVESGLSYSARPDDLFIVTYPKNGTTWTQQIVTLIFNKGELPESIATEGMFSVSPFLEMQGKEVVEKIKRPTAIKTHLSYDIQPKHPNAKYIVVLRNPKDTCVSFYYHHKRYPGYKMQDKNFHDFFPFWLDGQVECGDYFDWVLSWWPQKDKDNTLFLLYENMKQNPEESVLKIAQFMGDEYKQQLLANDKQILNHVLEKSSFDYMKKNNKMGSAKNHPVKEEERDFFRKGIIGDWKSHFTPEENESVEEKFRRKFKGTGLEHLWKEYGIFTE